MPLKLRLCKNYHDTPVGGHKGRETTYYRLHRDYTWPGMHQDVKRYVCNCHTCSRSKAPRHAKYGELHPLNVPEGPWKDISLDFIPDLPEAKGKNTIRLVIDRLTKQQHSIPCTKEMSSEDLAMMYLHEIWREHGMPNTVTSDRGAVFVSELMRRLCKWLGVEPKPSSAYYPETDGQTERANSVIEQYIRAFCSYRQDDWPDYLLIADFVANDSPSASTGMTPFFANKGLSNVSRYGDMS